MKKLIYVFITVILAVGILAGCSGVTETAESAPTAVPAAQSSSPAATLTPDVVQSEDPGYGAEGSFENPDAAVAQMLLYAIQDEYLARAEYEYLII